MEFFAEFQNEESDLAQLDPQDYQPADGTDVHTILYDFTNTIVDAQGGGDNPHSHSVHMLKQPRLLNSTSH